MKVKVGRTEIVLDRGDITEFEVDAIVNAANNQLSMGAGVASAIKRKGGTIIEEDAVRQGPIEAGDVVVTTAGNLPANYVIHAAVMGPDLRASADLVRQATLATLRRAEELRLHTLALPAFGAGVGRLPPQESAAAMVGALRTHFAEVAESSLRRIHLVLFQDDTYQAFGESLGLNTRRRAV
ncbi:MAG TPA: macro domain-containing protein [Methylomirabilota bacterium]|nr:macro domain-containing protein [Methylomirabilota bacterium]